jgi:hypothetical protein
MGIKGLNKYFKNNATPKSITKRHFYEFQHKRIVFDTSIYIYKYLEEGALIENMYTLICQCIEHDITPLFIFDGKPTETKSALLKARHIRKLDAYERLVQMETEYETQKHACTGEQRMNIMKEMNNLRKRSIRVRQEDIAALKSLMDTMNVYYCDAPYEADIVCAYHVLKKDAWACVSDDMDMFVYNCPRVLREWDIKQECTIMYNFDLIKQDIRLPSIYVRPLLLFVGNDYLSYPTYSMNMMMKWYHTYENENSFSCENRKRTSKDVDHFINWMVFNGNIRADHAIQIQKICSMFEVPEHMILKKPLPTTTCSISYAPLSKIMAQYGYVFVK